MPYCPTCRSESLPGLARCPVDRSLYHQRSCPCGGELWPRDRFCGACGKAAEGAPPGTPRPLPRAGRLTRLGAFLVDALALGLLLGETQRHSLAWIPIAWLAGLVYWGLLESGGRQTLGQHLFRVQVLDRRGLPLHPLQAARRYLWFTLTWPSALAHSPWWDRTGSAWYAPER